ncbi:MAG TPA: hypothetical protein PL037_01225 [Elusimicrobiales bacterium]|nr:hypothetical protein [Elusimicrobiales bacterium]
MDQAKFEKYQAARNVINKSLCVVIKTAGDNVTVHTRNGVRATFKAQYLEPVPETEAGPLLPIIDQLRKEEESRKHGAARIADPELIRLELEKYIRHIAIRYPAQAEAFRTFWTELAAAAGDQPGRTWEMKPSSASNPCPVLKIFNRTTQKWVYYMNLLAGYGLRLEVKKEFLPPGGEGLFPIDHAMFGAGRAVELDYRNFTPEKRRAYVDCVKAAYLAAGTPDTAADGNPSQPIT